MNHGSLQRLCGVKVSDIMGYILAGDDQPQINQTPRSS